MTPEGGRISCAARANGSRFRGRSDAGGGTSRRRSPRRLDRAGSETPSPVRSYAPAVNGMSAADGDLSQPMAKVPLITCGNSARATAANSPQERQEPQEVSKLGTRSHMAD